MAIYLFPTLNVIMPYSPYRRHFCILSGMSCVLMWFFRHTPYIQHNMFISVPRILCLCHSITGSVLMLGKRLKLSATFTVRLNEILASPMKPGTAHHFVRAIELCTLMSAALLEWLVRMYTGQEGLGSSWDPKPSWPEFELHWCQPLVDFYKVKSSADFTGVTNNISTWLGDTTSCYTSFCSLFTRS